MPPGSDRCVAVITPDSSRRSACRPSSSSASSSRLPSAVTSSRSAGSIRRSRAPISSTSRSGRDEPQRLEVGAQPLELVDQRPRVLGVEQHQVGDRGDVDHAEIAPAVDDRRLAGHQRRLGDGLLGARAADRRQRRARAAPSGRGRARCACRCPSSSSRRPAPSTRRPARTAPASRQAFRGAPSPGTPRPRCATPATTVRGAAPRVRRPPTPSRCRWTSGREPRAPPSPSRSTDCASEPGRCRSAVSDHSVVGAVAIISCESPSAPVSVPVIRPSAASSTGTHSLPSMSCR